MSAVDDPVAAPVRHAASAGTDRPAAARVLVAGVGNIGSFLAMLLAPIVGFMRLVDRDIVEDHNTANQLYGPEHVGRSKVEAMTIILRRLAPHVRIECRGAELEDLPWGDFADVDCVLGGVDSLRARQVISEKVYPLGIPYIDGGVGDPLLSRVQVLVPGGACLECSWGAGHYRQLSTEHPCRPGASTAGPRTIAPGCAGAATASAMVAQLIRLWGDDPPRHSYEINSDLWAGRMVASRRRLNARCRFPHATVPRVLRLARPLAEATIGDLLAALDDGLAGQTVQLEFRRGLLDEGLFGAGRIAFPEQLRQSRDRRLVHFGLTWRDRLLVRAGGGAPLAHVCFDTTPGA